MIHLFRYVLFAYQVVWGFKLGVAVMREACLFLNHFHFCSLVQTRIEDRPRRSALEEIEALFPREVCL